MVYFFPDSSDKFWKPSGIMIWKMYFPHGAVIFFLIMAPGSHKQYTFFRRYKEGIFLRLTANGKLIHCSISCAFFFSLKF